MARNQTLGLISSGESQRKEHGGEQVAAHEPGIENWFRASEPALSRAPHQLTDSPARQRGLLLFFRDIALKKLPTGDCVHSTWRMGRTTGETEKVADTEFDVNPLNQPAEDDEPVAHVSGHSHASGSPQ